MRNTTIPSGRDGGDSIAITKTQRLCGHCSPIVYVPVLDAACVASRVLVLILFQIYLQDSEVVVDGWRVWGSPWQPEFCDWAFNLPRGSKLKEKWDLIPDDIDVLITHGPPVRHGGTISRGVDVGCEDLMEAVLKLQPLVHVFGHVHEGYGVTYESGITFINASTCTHNYCADNPPCVFDLFKKKPLAQ